MKIIGILSVCLLSTFIQGRNLAHADDLDSKLHSALSKLESELVTKEIEYLDKRTQSQLSSGIQDVKEALQILNTYPKQYAGKFDYDISNTISVGGRSSSKDTEDPDEKVARLGAEQDALYQCVTDNKFFSCCIDPSMSRVTQKVNRFFIGFAVARAQREPCRN